MTTPNQKQKNNKAMTVDKKISYVGNTNIEQNIYSRIHRWIAKVKGKAIRCENKDCQCVAAKKYEWALIKGKTYDFVAENFMQLCSSCHRKYDYSEDSRRKISLALSNRHSNNIRKVMVTKEGYKEIFISITEASEKTGLSRTALQNVLSGLSKTTGGYTCHYQ